MSSSEWHVIVNYVQRTRFNETFQRDDAEKPGERFDSDCGWKAHLITYASCLLVSQHKIIQKKKKYNDIMTSDHYP